MEPDVSGTLSELERKLKELEYELEAVSHGHETPPAPSAPTSGPSRPWPPAPPVASWSGGDSPPAPMPAPDPLADVLRLRDDLLRVADELATALTRVVGASVAPAWPPTPGTAAASPSPVAPPAEPPRAPARPADPAATVFAGRVTLNAGPFTDMATLGAFEQALRRTAGVLDVYVRALDAGRATIDVELSDPVALATELRHISPVGFEVVDAGDGRLELTIEAVR